MKRFRFSLRTLVLLVCLAAAGFGLWWRWDPWIQTQILEHQCPVRTALFSPNGRHILTGGAEARLWDPHTGRQIKVLGGHTEAVFTTHYINDGQQILTYGDDGMIRLWDARSGELLKKYHKFTKRVWITDSEHLANFSPDGRKVAKTSLSEEVSVQDKISGKELCVLKGHEDSVYTAEFSRDGNRIVTASHDGTSIVFDAKTGRQLLKLKDRFALYNASFSSKGQWVLTTGEEGKVGIWSARSGKRVAVLKGHRSAVYSAHFSPDDNLIVTGGRDRTVRIWKRRRPEWWLGPLWLPEFWLTLVFGVGLAWSVWRDWKGLRSAPTPKANPA